MTCAHSSGTGSRYRVVLMSTSLRGIFVETSSGGFSLPCLSVPPQTRTAAGLQKAAQHAWGVPIFILDILKTFNTLPCCAIAQLLSATNPGRLILVEMDAVPLSELTNEERATVEDIYSCNEKDRGPFSRMDWLVKAIAWIQSHIDSRAELTTVEQFNASATFSLFRLRAESGRPYWLKATGAPNLHELPVTTALAKICPRYLPSVLAKRLDWNAWLMEDAGTSLDLYTEKKFVTKAVAAMAELQKATTDHVEYLLAAGTVDQRIPVMRSSLSIMLTYFEEAMEMQTSTKAPRLGTARLREVGRILGDAFSAMESLNIPDTVIHGDMNRGNILMRGGDCVFTDWCEARIGNPFLTFQHMQLLSNSLESVNQTKNELMDAYRQPWSDCLTHRQIDWAFRLAPPLAICSYLYGRGDWLNSSPKTNPNFASYARSLARHLERELRKPQLLEALCH